MSESCLVIVDGGTTRTRIFASVGPRLLARQTLDLGARDVAREGNPQRLRAALQDALGAVTRTCTEQGHTPMAVLAAGMITSPQGLVEVPHVSAPADAAALARGMRRIALPALGDLPVWMIPGVRSGPARVSGVSAVDDVLAVDFMRGEETLAIGLAAGPLATGGILLSVGSHWKAITVAAGAVTGSVSTLSGETLAAVQAGTILASALPSTWPETLDPAALHAGVTACARTGLPRAFYAVRLLEQRAPSSAEERLAFLVGATIAADRAVLVGEGHAPVLIAGGGPVATAWATVLEGAGRPARVLGTDETEAAFRRGAAAVLAAHGGA